VGERAGEWLRARPLLVDAIVALAVLAAGLSVLLAPTDYARFGLREPDPLGVVLIVLSCLPLIWRRVAPLGVLLVVAVPTAISTAHSYASGAGGLSVLIAVYTVAAYRRRSEAFVGLVAGLVTFLVSLPFAAATSEVSGTDIVAVVGIVFAAHAFGRSIGFRRAYTAELELRAERLEQARESDLRAVIAEERGRIARELHDVVAHHVSVMTVQASAAQRTLDRDPGRSREAMAAVEQTGRQALVDMRRIVGVLRADGEDACDRAPQPGTDDLCALVEQVREAGLRTEVVVSGHQRRLPPGVDLTVYRIVQEALTNTLKHGGPTQALVSINFGTDAIGVEVRDQGRGAAANLATDGRPRGHGLLGMRERVALYGGHLQAGPRPGGGYEVSAHIPLEHVSS
jgi:signal transduction histidine kinase